MEDHKVESKTSDVLHNYKNSSRSTVRQGLPYKNRAVDCDIWQWRNAMLKLRGGKLVTKSEVQNYAREVYSKAGILNFKASDGWYRRWLSRRKTIGVNGNDKDKAVGVQPLTSESKQIEIISKNKLRMCKAKSHFKEKINISKSNKSVCETEKDASIDLVNQINLNQYSMSTFSSKFNQIIPIEFISNEEERHTEENGNIPLVLNIGDKSLTNANVEKIFKIGVTDVESTAEQNDPQKKEILKDTLLCIGKSSMDEFCKTSILDKNDVICNKKYANSISGNVNRTPSNSVNSEIFVGNSFENQPQKSTVSNTCEGKEKIEILKLKRGKEIITNLNINKVRKKGERYMPHFKSKVAASAASSSIKAAAMKFNISRGTVSEWLKERERRSGAKLIVKTLTDNKELADVVFINWLETHQDKLSHQLIQTKTWELFEGYEESILQKTCPWFLAYIRRLNEKKFDQKLCNKKNIIYPEKFKLQVVRFAQKFSQLAAARIFLIARKRIFEWLSKVKSTGAVKVKGPTSSYVTDPAIDNQISKWYKEQSFTPSSKQVREKGQQLYKKAGYTLNCSHGWYYRWRLRIGLPTARSDNSTHDSFLLEWILTKLDNNQNISHNDLLSIASKLKKSSSTLHFKPSLGWAFRFCKRYPKLLQSTPDISVPLPPTMELKVETYKKNVLSCIKGGNIGMENIVSMDEIPLHFLLSGNSKRMLLVRRPGFDTCQGSVVISSLANGMLLPFMLILKGTDSFPLECGGLNNIVVSETGCIDDDIMLLWLQRVCFMKVIENGILINDCFEHHTCTEAVKQLLLHNIQHLVIPGGCSSRLQPLNYIAQQLKYKVEQYWAESLKPDCWADGTSRLETPSHTQIIDWVKKSYSSVAVAEQENIKRTFQQIFFLKDGFSEI